LQQNTSYAAQAYMDSSHMRPSQEGMYVTSFKDVVARRKFAPPEIEVCDPTIKADTIGKHHVFKVKGRDHQGDFEVFRRFKQFDLLRKVLFARFLGLYVPPIPEKKAMGNTDNFFVEERMFYLNKFIKDVCLLPYLYESAEFAAFLRPSGDVDHCLQSLPPLNTEAVLGRLRELVPMNEAAADESKVKHYNENVINVFVKECNGLLVALTNFKNQMKVVVPIKEQEVLTYKSFVDFLVKYEEVNGKAMAAGSLSPTDGQPMLLANDTTSLLKGHWGDELKIKLTNTA
jgi:PX domain